MKRVSQFPVMRTAWPRIVDYRANRLRSFMVDARKRGNGRRYYFRRLADAERCAKRLAIQRERLGNAILNFETRDMVAAIECQQLLLPFGKSIRDATQHLIAHLAAEAERTKAPLVRECVEQFIATRRRDAANGELAQRSFAGLMQSMKRVVAAAGKMPITEFDVARVTAFLDSFSNRRTRSNWRLKLSNLFTFCKSKGWITANPCAEIKVKVPRHEITVLSVDDAERLLRAAEASGFHGTMVPFFAISLFCGLRGGEATALRWEQIDLVTSHVHVLGKNSKTRQSRFVPLPPNLMRWLLPYRRVTGRVIGPNFRRQFEFVRRDAGLCDWRPSICRHSFCSYALALHENRHQVCEWAGHSAATFAKFYLRPILKSEGARYFQLMPLSTNSALNGEA